MRAGEGKAGRGCVRVFIENKIIQDLNFIDTWRKTRWSRSVRLEILVSREVEVGLGLFLMRVKVPTNALLWRISE